MQIRLIQILLTPVGSGLAFLQYEINRRKAKAYDPNYHKITL